MKHYVYRITHLSVNRHYIGVRSTKINPVDDLGHRYFSSSRDQEFILAQKLYPDQFRYKIVRQFDNRSKAVLFEIKLHAKFDVGRNPAFINRAKQTNTKFSTIGMVSVSGQMMTIEEFRLSGLKHHKKGWKIATDKTGLVFNAHKDDNRFFTEEIWSASKGLVRAIHPNGSKITVTSKDYYNGDYTCNNTGMVPAIDHLGKKRLVTKNEFKNGNFKHVSSGRITAIIKDTGESCSVTLEEFVSGGYQGFNKGRINGSDNPNAKIICIFDADHNLKFSTFGNFNQVCADNKLPFAALRRSYSNEGIPIFSTKKTKSDARRLGKEKFIGWYAKIEKP